MYTKHMGCIQSRSNTSLSQKQILRLSRATAEILNESRGSLSSDQQQSSGYRSRMEELTQEELNYMCTLKLRPLSSPSSMVENSGEGEASADSYSNTQQLFGDNNGSYKNHAVLLQDMITDHKNNRSDGYNCLTSITDAQDFVNYLQYIKADENIKFLIAVNRFEHLCKDASKADQAKRLGQQIHRRFIHRLNISGNTREHTSNNINNCDQQDGSVFAKAKAEIEILIGTSILPAYLRDRGGHSYSLKNTD
jgi:hypothetical protein